METEITPEAIIAAYIGVDKLNNSERYEWKARGKAWLATASDADYAAPDAVIFMAAASIQ